MTVPAIVSNNSNESSGTTISAPAPSGVTATDLVVLIVTWADMAATGDATVTGFTQRGATQHFTNTGYNGHMAVFDSAGTDMTGAGPWTVTVPSSSLVNRTLALRLDAFATYNVGPTSFSQTISNAALAIAAVTTTLADALVLCHMADDSAQTSSTPSGFTNETITGTITNTYLWSKAQASAGSSGTPTTTGSGTAGDRLGITVAYIGPSVPAQVTGLTAVGKPGRAALSWSAPANGGSAITDYLIERAPDVAGSPGTYATVTDGTSTATTYTDTGLTNGSVYWYRVSAINVVGTGTASTAASASPTAHPWLEADAEEHGTSLGTSNAVTLPTGSTTGDLIIAFVGVDLAGSATGSPVTASTGWTAITNTQQTQGTTVVHCRAFARVLDGSGSDALAVTGPSQDYVVITHRITDHGVTNASINTAIVAAGTTGSSTNGNPPADNPAVSKAWLWLAGIAVDATTGNTITGVPTNYTQVRNIVSVSSTSSVVVATAQRRLTATSEDPGTFTHVNRPWCTVTIAVPPVAALVATLGIASETDSTGQFGMVLGLNVASTTATALALGRRHGRILGIATETDTVGAVGMVLGLNIAVETDTALALGRAKRKALGVATETDTAGTMTRALARLLGIATETDTAGAVGEAKRKALGIASEADTALVLGRRKAKALGIASETDTALSLGRAKRRALGVASETDTARQVGMVLGLNAAVETDSALALGRRKAKALGVASETDTALALGRRHVRLLGVAAETDTARPLATTLSAGLGTAAETDTAQPLGRRHTRALGAASETDTAVALTRRHVRALGVASEVDTAGTLGRRKRKALGIAVEADSAQTLGAKTKPLATASEIDTALGLVRVHARALGIAAEADAALVLGRRKTRLIGVASETDVPGTVGGGRVVAIGPAVETDVARPFGRRKTITLGIAVEVDTAGLLGGSALPIFTDNARTRRVDPPRVTARADRPRTTVRVDGPRLTAKVP